MNAVELIRKKRNGGILTRAEMESFITAYVQGTVPDYQMSAFLMAVYFSGMGPEETSTFTDVMLHSESHRPFLYSGTESGQAFDRRSW